MGNFFRKSILCFFLTCLLLSAHSQCDCVPSNLNTSSDYTIFPGQSLCVSAGLVYTGKLTIAGGILCNKGSVTNLKIISGTIHNYGKITTEKAQIVTSSLKLISYPLSEVMFKQGIVFTASQTDSLKMVVHEGGTIVTQKDIVLNSGVSFVELGRSVGSNTVFPIAKFLVEGDVIVNSSAIVSIKNRSEFNVYNFTVVSGNEVVVINSGSLTINKNLNVVNTLEGKLISLTNKGEMLVKANANLSIPSSSATITNIASGRLQIDGSFSLHGINTRMVNAGNLIVQKNINISEGKLVNSRHARAKNISLKRAIIENNSLLKATNNLVLEDSLSELINTKVVRAQNNLINSGTIRLKEKSNLIANKLDNFKKASQIIGDVNSTNNTIYPEIVVDSASRNAGSVSGRAYFTDKTASTQSFDVVGSDSEISSTILFASAGRCLRLTPGSFFVEPSKEVYCYGDDIHIGFAPEFSVQHLSWSYSGSSTSTVVSNHDFDFTIYGLISGGTVMLCGEWWDGSQWCGFCETIDITMSNVSVAATSPLYFGIGNNVTLNCTPSGGTSYSFNWQPNVYFVSPSSNTDEDPVVAPKVSLTYTVTVTDEYGCQATTTVQVIAKPFAVLEKKVNREYYDLFNNQLLFKYDGQYANSGLIYRVYDWSYKDVSINSPFAPVNITSVNAGDNRYILDAANLSTGYYILEVINEKNEKLYLRFKR